MQTVSQWFRAMQQRRPTQGGHGLQAAEQGGQVGRLCLVGRYAWLAGRLQGEHGVHGWQADMA